MKLISLEITKAEGGLAFPETEFAEKLTHLNAANSSGKTVVIEMLCFALGYPAKFRNEIYEKCRDVLLIIEAGGSRVKIKRKISESDVLVSVKNETTGEDEVFYNISEYSDCLFRIMGKKLSDLTGVGKQVTKQYFATYLPLFYLNQDTGYTSVYSPQQSFIQDQFNETIRFAFDLPAKNPYLKKSKINDLNNNIEVTNKKLVSKRDLVNKLYNNLDDKSVSLEELEENRDSLTKKLSEINANAHHKSSVISEFDELIINKQSEVSRQSEFIEDLKVKCAGLREIKHEIATEINTLNLNEEAKKLFDSFSEICSNSSCSLFLASQETYAKNLLYLKDQIKELDGKVGEYEESIKRTSALLSQSKKDLDALIASRNTTFESANDSGIVDLVKNVTIDLINTQNQITSLSEVRNTNDQILKLELERSKFQNQLGDLKSNKGLFNTDITKLRQKLEHCTIKWLNILHAVNVPKSISFDSSFKFKLGDGEALSKFKGSTRIRIVLAIHTAIIELIIKNTDSNCKFFILDTPKQQEIQTSDLSTYLEAVKSLAQKHDMQFIFSSTELDIELGARDTEWSPMFEGIEQPMYLG